MLEFMHADTFFPAQTWDFYACTCFLHFMLKFPKQQPQLGRCNWFCYISRQSAIPDGNAWQQRRIVLVTFCLNMQPGTSPQDQSQFTQWKPAKLHSPKPIRDYTHWKLILCQFECNLSPTPANFLVYLILFYADGWRRWRHGHGWREQHASNHSPGTICKLE